VETGTRPIIILAVDGLRADALGCYGAPAATPAFDALAAESIRFEWAFAQAPHIQPSLATLFSGLYPTSNGLRQPGEFLSKDATTLAEVLGTADFATGAFLEGAAASGDYGLAQGFETFSFSTGPGVEATAWIANRAAGSFLAVFGGWSQPASEKVQLLLGDSGAPEDFSTRVQEVLASRLTDSPEAFTADELEWVRSWYAARTQVIDSLLADFMDSFRAHGLGTRAILVVMGSNGFELQEQGGLFGEDLLTPVTHVPLLVRLPGGAKAQSVSKVVEVVDLMPTVLDLAGQEVPAGIQGRSLVPIIEGSGQPPYIAFAESPQAGGQRFVALGGMAMASGAGGVDAQLFDLMSDPLQLENVGDSQPDKLDVMVRQLQAWEKMVAVASLDPKLRAEEDLDEETLKQLKSLGYIQ
jgi:arylsulfatase A-like enzyme